MAYRKLIWTHRAVNDKISIYQYWNKRNKSKTYSSKLDKLFSNSAKLLCDFPHSGLITDCQDIKLKTVRNYQLFYKIYDDSIAILTVWDSRQNPDDLLL